MLSLNTTDFADLEKVSKCEWLETNGLGGWSSASVTGLLTRRYHGLLVAATHPPAERMNLVSKLDETIMQGGKRFELSTNLYPNETFYPNGFQYIKSFTRGLFPEWLYEAGTVILKKSILMLHNENTVLVRYEATETTEPFILELQPFISARGYHSLQKENSSIDTDVLFENDLFQIKPYKDSPEIFIHTPGSHYRYNPDWYRRFTYAAERDRGLDFEEDLFVPGTISTSMVKGDILFVIVSTENPGGRNAGELFELELVRREKLLAGPFVHAAVQILTLAADQFIVKRGQDLKTIIAGYHWFTDWSRDTMISLPGLTLSTGRFDDARKIIAAFAMSVSQGMLPNRFQDNHEPPEYNTVDGTLWYFVAVYKYLEKTGDLSLVLKEVLPVLKEIIDWHFRGTRYNIHVDKDGLLYAGEEGQQLTWMDARINNWVVTPRMGKPVEIQALWYNALMIFASLLEKNNQHNDADLVRLSAGSCRESFLHEFWFSGGGYLYDVIDENGVKDSTLRPNQLFAISLPFPLIDGDKAMSILTVVEEELVTPVGLRTLSASHINYQPLYGGDPLHRDSAYHQGTVWSWLLGAYVDAIMKISVGVPNDNSLKKGNLQKADSVIQQFIYHLNEGCIGSVSEIFDAQAPHHPEGCVAQAWGVAEILRVIKEYGLHAELK